jgi:hypothetical protein
MGCCSVKNGAFYVLKKPSDQHRSLQFHEVVKLRGYRFVQYQP